MFPAAGTNPFYIVGHNPNSIEEVIAALDAGANAIEPDVNVYADRPDEFCVGEAPLLDPGEGSSSDAPPLDEFLTALHEIAVQRPELALVVFDCKPEVATPDRGAALMDAIRTRLTYDTNLNVIVSVARCSEAVIFRSIGAGLGVREGGMIDEENDPAAVTTALGCAGVVHSAFGNGISFLNSVLGPHVRPSMERACALRAATSQPRFIYVWTVNDEDLMREYVRIGVDGIITGCPAALRKILSEPQFQTLARLATRDDNPFQPSNAAYALEIRTGPLSAPVPGNITFTLTGSAGSSTVMVDASWPCRMEPGQVNHIIVRSGDLGALESVTARLDASCAPGWNLVGIKVESFRYAMSKQAVFNVWIDSTEPVTRPLA